MRCVLDNPLGRGHLEPPLCDKQLSPLGAQVVKTGEVLLFGGLPIRCRVRLHSSEDLGNEMIGNDEERLLQRDGIPVEI